MEEEEGIRKVESLLRGRLIAERASSKLAKQETDQLQQKLEELETQLKSEIKSKNKAEKKLNFLIKKLNSLKIPYSLEDSEKGDMSSVSSSLTQVEEKDSKAQIEIHENCEAGEIEKKGKRQTGLKDFRHDISQILTSNQNQNCNRAEVDDQSSSKKRSSVRMEDNDKENIDQMQDESQSKTIKEASYEEKANSEKSNENNRKRDDQSSCSSTDRVEEKKRNEAQDDSADVSLALVLVDLPNEPPAKHIDPLILDTNVKHVLDALSSAKQKLLLSMERRHTIRAGSKVRYNNAMDITI